MSDDAFYLDPGDQFELEPAEGDDTFTILPVHDWTYNFEGIQQLAATPLSQVHGSQDILGVIPAPDEDQDFMLSRLAADEPLAIIDQSQIEDGGEQPLVGVQGVPTANLGSHAESDILGVIKTPSEEFVSNVDFTSNEARHR